MKMRLVKNTIELEPKVADILYCKIAIIKRLIEPTVHPTQAGVIVQFKCFLCMCLSIFTIVESVICLKTSFKLNTSMICTLIC